MLDKELSVHPPLGDTKVNKRERGVDHEEFLMEDEEAWDDVSREALDPKGVQRARMAEIGYINDKEAWVKITRAEAMRKGIKVIDTRWTDVN